MNVDHFMVSFYIIYMCVWAYIDSDDSGQMMTRIDAAFNGNAQHSVGFLYQHFNQLVVRVLLYK